MKKIMILMCAAAICGTGIASAMPRKKTESPRQQYKVYVDKEGVMRRDDTKEEVSYYGTNYTLPFAYSYRALGYLGKDRKEAIDRDVYQMARLGFNAFRLHLWDAELADSVGNLLENDHLDLLDYLICSLEARGIDIVLTAQTNFGNGYPEKNIDTGAFTYDFDKCKIHEDTKAQEIQERYLTQLAQHVNTYTNRSYADDNAIIAMEINNEPCHSGTKKEVTSYINKMAKAIRNAGFDKPILYNVTHNPDVTEAYYAADIEGTTFQWYPIGLVANHERKGNFLPMLDEYCIPWKKSMKNYNKLARVVYEFDPADVLYSYLYPAVVRTFRKEGFQWITQFAYDPTDIAQYNTEYPTHYMNLLYTPAKALSMMVAVETAKETPRGADYGNYPDNQQFGHTRVSYEEDLSEFNSPTKFIYSNSTSTTPLLPDSLQQIAGHGNSPLVSYCGSGAYFLDRLDTNHWRLEVMPDATVLSDPFHDTSLYDTKVAVTEDDHEMTLSLPGLGKEFQYMLINTEDGVSGSTADGTITIRPGTYLLIPTGENLPQYNRLFRGTAAGNLRLTEYGGVTPDRMPVTLLAAEDHDKDLDICMIPEGWNFRIERMSPHWDEPTFYQLTTNPEKDGKLVMRRYVGDKTMLIPESANITKMKVHIYNSVAGIEGMSLPEGTVIAVVGRDGATYSAPLNIDEDGFAEIPCTDFQPSEGVIIPAPYPVMMTRTIAKQSTQNTAVKDIEFVELIIPQTAGKEQRYLIDRIWAE